MIGRAIANETEAHMTVINGPEIMSKLDISSYLVGIFVFCGGMTSFAIVCKGVNGTVTLKRLAPIRKIEKCYTSRHNLPLCKNSRLAVLINP